MEIKIREVSTSDIGGIIGLMREFAEYEMLAESLLITETKLAKALFDEGSFVEGLVALDGEKLFGYAIFYPHFSSFSGQVGYYLEDIFISAGHRGKAVGEKMLRTIAGKARARGFERIDFQVLDWNKSAITFYEKLGAVGNYDESHYKFAGEAFQNLASG